MTIREAFDKGTETFNAHDIDGFTSVLADDAVFRAPGGINGQGKAAEVSWSRLGPAEQDAKLRARRGAQRVPPCLATQPLA